MSSPAVEFRMRLISKFVQIERDGFNKDCVVVVVVAVGCE